VPLHLLLTPSPPHVDHVNHAATVQLKQPDTQNTLERAPSNGTWPDSQMASKVRCSFLIAQFVVAYAPKTTCTSGSKYIKKRIKEREWDDLEVLHKHATLKMLSDSNPLGCLGSLPVRAGMHYVTPLQGVRPRVGVQTTPALQAERNGAVPRFVLGGCVRGMICSRNDVFEE
jgi:hypothetical protein